MNSYRSRLNNIDVQLLYDLMPVSIPVLSFIIGAYQQGSGLVQQRLVTVLYVYSIPIPYQGGCAWRVPDMEDRACSLLVANNDGISGGAHV